MPTDRPSTFSQLLRQHSRSSSQLASLIPLSPTTSSGLPSRSCSPDLVPSPERREVGAVFNLDGDEEDGEEGEGEEEGSGLAKFIQQKRRQASAPFFTSARSGSLFLPGVGGGGSGVGGEAEEGEGKGSRSRRGSLGSRRGTTGSLRLGGNLGLPFEEIEGMVMTPTTEEWRQLGGDLSSLASLQALSNPPSTTSSSSSLLSLHNTFSSISAILSPSNPPPTYTTNNPNSFTDSPLSPPTPPPQPKPRSSFSYQTSHTGFTHKPSPSLSTPDSFFSPGTSPPKPQAPRMSPSSSGNGGGWIPSHRPQQGSDSSVRPNLSRGSLSSATGTPTPSSNPFPPTQTPGPGEEESPLEEGLPLTAVPLDKVTNLGPVDPRRYSAVTGLRDIGSFLVEGEAGKGAYGTVRKARLKGVGGEAVGPELIIKFVIKQRILADCWKKHKVLGPIPIEVHVLDHLRRVPYFARPTGRRRNNHHFKSSGQLLPRRDSEPSLKAGTLTGHPNICGMLDFFEDGEFYYLVMPQAGADPDDPTAPKGQDLFDYVDLHPDGLSPPSIRSIFSQIADALYFLHEHGIVHRDIKDENIVLDHRGHVMVIDFGSAAYVAKDGTRFDTFSGTLDFAAPEVLRGQRYGGKETDIWALGVLVYVLICGECPFWSPEEAIRGLEPGSRAELALRAKCTPAGEGGEVPEIVEAPTPEGAGSMSDAVDLVMCCLEVDPANRPSADAILDHKFVMGSDGWIGRKGWMEEVD